MSEFGDIMQDAAAEAEGIIASMQGVEDGAAAFLYNGGRFTGVFGQATIEEIPQPGGGYRRRSVLPLTVTRTQTDFVPRAKVAPIVRLSPAITYTIDKFDANDPLVWVLMLVKQGE